MAKNAGELGKRTAFRPWSVRRLETDPRAAVLILSALVGVSVVLSPAGPAWGQCGSPTLNVMLTQTIEVFRVGDFDPSDAHFHPHVFTVVMCNDLAQSRHVMLGLVIESDTYGTLATGETAPFELEPGTTNISNQDLTEASGNYELEGYDISPDAEDLEELILELGYLPEGRYCFRLTMEPAGDGPYDFSAITVENCLTVTNPLNLEILLPGAPFGEDLPLVLSTHPQFQWTSRASSWRVRIAEVEPGDASGEDVLENVPVYEAELSPPDVLGGGGAGTISWIYPSAGEDLEGGKSYCWQVTALVETSGGTEEIESEVFCFRRWDPADLGTEPLLEALALIMQQLQDELGAELEGMTPTGGVLVDGQAVDLETLRGILEDIASGKLEVQEIRLE